MPKRSRKPPADPNVAARRVVDRIIARTEDVPAEDVPAVKNAAAQELGRRGGLKGGKSRMAMLTPEQRTAMAKAAAAKRWSKQDG